MKEHFTETHAHTKEVSPCGGVDAKTLVDLYLDAGYSTVVITDHFSRFSMPDIQNMNKNEITDRYLQGYRIAQEHAKGRIHILLGMELTFYANCNDYLIYGMTEQFLHDHTNLMDMTLESFYPLAKENGLLVFQAHPFRNNITVVNPAYLDGVEAFNGNPRHDSRNDIAQAWANKFNLLTTSGSDFHQVCDVARGGILTNEAITDNARLLEVLCGTYKLYCV